MWIVNTNSGRWEGDKLKQVAKDIANYYREDEDNYYPSVEGILHINDEDIERYFPKAIAAMDKEIEEWHSYYVEADSEEKDYYEEVRSDYYARCM